MGSLSLVVMTSDDVCTWNKKVVHEKKSKGQHPPHKPLIPWELCVAGVQFQQTLQPMPWSCLGAPAVSDRTYRHPIPTVLHHFDSGGSEHLVEGCTLIWTQPGLPVMSRTFSLVTEGCIVGTRNCGVGPVTKGLSGIKLRRIMAPCRGLGRGAGGLRARE